jgi:hypothetical protein
MSRMTPNNATDSDTKLPLRAPHGARHCLNSVLGAVGLFLITASHSGERILVQVPAAYDSGAPVVDAVRRECGIESMVGNHVFRQVSARFPMSLQIQKPGAVDNEKYLMLTILAVQGVGGGSWSGSKSITIRADLLQNGKPIATKVLNRGSRGGAFGGMSGTCPIMERIAGALGRDTVGWLQTLASGAPDASPTSESQPTSPASE